MKTQNLTVIRGDQQKINFVIYEDLTASLLSFVVKENKEFTSDRLIEKKSPQGISIIVSADVTTITVTLEPADTQDLTGRYYVYDIVQDDYTTLVSGTITLIGDVQTPFDGFATPETAKRFITIDVEDSEIGDIIQTQFNSLGNKKFTFISLTELKSQLTQLP